MNLTRRQLFKKSLPALAGASAICAIPLEDKKKTNLPIDQYHVGRVIENFDIAHPPKPWGPITNRPGGETRKLWGFEIWWDPWFENYGLYAPDTRQMFALCESGCHCFDKKKEENLKKLFADGGFPVVVKRVRP